jgi:hypothetical protein
MRKMKQGKKEDGSGEVTRRQKAPVVTGMRQSG